MHLPVVFNFFLCLTVLLDIVHCSIDPVRGGCWPLLLKYSCGILRHRKNFIRKSIQNGKCVIIQPASFFSSFDSAPKRAICPSYVRNSDHNRKLLNLNFEAEFIVKDQEDWISNYIVQFEKCVTVDAQANNCQPSEQFDDSKLECSSKTNEFTESNSADSSAPV